MTDEAAQDFNWGELGEKWWREAGAQFGASQLQIKFAAAKHRGVSNTQAAREAGYSDDGETSTIRQLGYRAFRTTAVSNMLALAAADARAVLMARWTARKRGAF